MKTSPPTQREGDSRSASDTVVGTGLARVLVPLLGILTAIAITAMRPSGLHAERQGAPSNRAGLCGFGQTCNDPFNGCHSGVGSSPTLVWDVTQRTEALPPFYEPGASYGLRLEVEDPIAWYLGFQLIAAADCPLDPVNAGTMEIVEAGRTVLVQDEFLRDWLTHRCDCPGADEPDCCGFVPWVMASGTNEWDFDWTAPPRGTGEIRFNVAFNSADGDGSPIGDTITARTIYLAEEPCPDPIADLRVTILDCDPGFPGEARVALDWTPSGAPTTFIRTTTDRALLEPGPLSWDLLADGCAPFQAGTTVVYYSIAESCELGGEGLH